MTYNDQRIFANGESFPLPAEAALQLQTLADQRALPPGRLVAAGEPLLLQWLNEGAMHVGAD